MVDYREDYLDDYNVTNNTMINSLARYDYEALHNHDNKTVVKVI
jgi:hypothetical protein